MAAAAASSPPLIIQNGSKGLFLRDGTHPFPSVTQLFPRSVPSLDISPDGKLLVYADTTSVKVHDLIKGSTSFEVAFPACSAKFSPTGRYLAMYNNFKSSPAGQPEEPNLKLYNVSTQSLMGSFVSKKAGHWGVTWTSDEAVCFRLNNTDLQAYEGTNFERWVHRFETQKVNHFDVATNVKNGCTMVSCYSSGTKGQPSFVKIYRYPQLSNPLNQKSFYRADSVNFMWSPSGQNLLFSAIEDIDKTGQSYYGGQKLNFMEAGVNGNNYTVSLDKDGPLHAASWVKKGNLIEPGKEEQYIVVYGFHPAKVALFDVKGNVVFNFGGTQMSANLICLNPFGNLVALCGFGNLRGGVFVWDIEKKKQLAEFVLDDTNDICWHPDGQTLMTSTISPRLRVMNGFRVYKYNGTSLFQDIFPQQVELYKVYYQPRPGVYPKPEIQANFRKAPSAQPTAKYVPPGQRDKEQYMKQMKQILNPKAPKSELDKQIEKVKKTLNQIKGLKRKKEEGVYLDKDQLAKIDREEELAQELEQLSLQ